MNQLLYYCLNIITFNKIINESVYFGGWISSIFLLTKKNVPHNNSPPPFSNLGYATDAYMNMKTF